MIVIDTNYIIRFLTKDNEELYKIAFRLLTDNKENLYIPSVVLAESNYILQSNYSFTKKRVLEILTSLIHYKNVSVELYIPLSFSIYENEKISFYDCLILSEALTNNADLKTFDKKLEKVFIKYKKA